ncbi:MAG: hypothetical protein COA96_08090 [SAR86 cluster bacterium]|uniref:DUF2306 domain-containing protein n=1 Tax=SAR86 cluster bacterium TaxID=2030880 RepID=A0A2A5B0P3_9GAMM|nr:MAG: hypothetical protein COA96_08090 [SAR86 cluster bacterium]
MTDVTQSPASSIAVNHDLVLYYSSRALLAIVWVSSFIFGLYILANYAAAYFDNDLSRWNNVLPGIYVPGELAASIGIGLHFAAGGVVLLLGGLQLIKSIRSNYPRVHHWTGRFYIAVCMVAAIGGLFFIAVRGTVGGLVMDIGFSLYGILMFLASVQTLRFAMKRQLLQHQAWAWRLYALAIGSWLYRMDYGLWLILTDWIGHTEEFDGWFDNFMAFFFYLPNLMIVELLIRARDGNSSKGLRVFTSVTMILSCGILIVATWGFAQIAWLPAISAWLGS